MEQKAVTYKTIKGMARDMAMSSGNNDFSYENYNIRITTRGKEDSLVVTNEKGTESNIIATRDVLKTVNNVFVGMQPGFYIDEYTEVTGSNIDKYDYTELYKESEDAQHNTIYVPIEKKDYEDAHLVQYDTYSVTAETFEDIKLALYIKVSDDYIKLQEDAVFDEEQTYYRKNIVVDPSITFYKKNEINTITPLVDSTTSGGTTTYTDNGVIKFALNTEYPTKSDLVVKSSLKINETPITYDGEQYTLLNDGEYTNDNLPITILKDHNYGYDTESIKDIVLNGATDDGAKGDEEIDDKLWLDSYKRLYKKITDNNFTFSGFDTRMNDITYVDSTSLSNIPVSLTSESVTLPTGDFKQGETYEDGIVGTPQTTTGDYKKVVANIPQLGYFTGLVYAKKYPTNTTIYAKQFLYTLRIPIFKKAEAFSSVTYYNIGTHGDGYTTSYSVATNVTSDNYADYYVISNYVEAQFNFDIFLYIGGNFSKNASSVSVKNIDGTSTAYTAPIVKIYFTFYSPSNPNSACIRYEVNGLRSQLATDGKYCLEATGPFFKENIKDSSTDTVPDIINGNSITFFKTDIQNTTSATFENSSDYIKCVSTTNLPNGYSFASKYEEATDVTADNFNDKRSNLYYINNGEYTSAASLDYDSTKTYFYKRGKDTTVISYNSNLYNVYSYEISDVSSSDSKIVITNIKTTKDNKIYKSEITLSNSVVLVYNKLSNTIKISGDSNPDYYIYQITIDNHPVPYIIYTTQTLEDIDDNSITAYSFGGSSFSQVSVSGTAYTMLPYDLKSDKVQICVGNGTISKSNGVYKFNDSLSDTGSTIKSFERLTYLPIYETNDFEYTLVSSSDDFTEYKNEGYKFYEIDDNTYVESNPQPTTYTANKYYVKINKTTSVDSLAKVLYENPDYYVVVNHFGFEINKFKSSIDVQSFRLQRSNNNWDNNYIYNFLSQGSDFVDYTRKIIPMSVLDTYRLSQPIVTYGIGKITFNINITDADDNYFGSQRLSDIHVTICDKSNKSFSINDTLDNFVSLAGVDVITTPDKKDDSSMHDFYIKEIRDNIPSDINLEVDETNNNIGFEDKYNANETVTLQILKGKNENAGRRFAREIIDFGDYKFTSTIEFDFNSTDSNYKNKFYSIINNNLLVANFGDYHSLTIPGRILGSCTVDDYVVLFFHYSSPALNYYKYDSTNDVYVLCPPNSIDLTNPDYYNLYTRNNKLGFDLAAKNGSLLRDDNNDYINGKNEDYIVKLKYIDAKPDNDENEWSEIVTKISNVSTQSSLGTDVIMKKPYYSADILYHGNLGFNANNGIETIGYYESKDVIKVYFTDGKNQPRMIDIMTPLAQRNGTHKRWDAKSFDFIQEISGKEKYEITKQFGGGAFPSGTVQYYFTYTNLGGCETNPFICSQLYYSSQSDTGNSPMKITDNTFKIKLTNLSTRFDYVNIYSVVRGSKDLQPICKRVINVSLNGKTEFEFTDNNLLGEIVDSSYLLMLQGTPISALTMAEKDNTLFLGNINKLQKSLSVEDKEKLRNCFIVEEGVREYQNYNPSEENWYENKVKDKVKLDYYGNEVKDASGNNIIDSKISLEENSSDIKTFMYNEYYRLGIQLQDKFGKWSDPVFIKDVRCNRTIETSITESANKDDKTTFVDSLISKTPYFYLNINNVNELMNIINDYGYIRIRPVIVYPNISSRNVLCQGLLNPTMFNYSDRSMNAPYNFASYFFRPIPPAISNNKDEGGNSLHNPSLYTQRICGYPIEYRHGYPINGYHDAIEEGLARENEIESVDENTVKALVDNYLANVDLSSVKLSSNTIGWWINSYVYLREGTVIVHNMRSVTYKAGAKIVEVNTSKNKGDIKNLITLTEDKPSSDYGDNTTDIKGTVSANKLLGNLLTGAVGYGSSPYSKCVGFKSHMHYFKNAFAHFAMVSWDNIASLATNDTNLGNEVIKEIGDTKCYLMSDGIVFNEGKAFYKATYPVEIKFIPKSDIKFKKHRGLKRKTYFSDIVVKPVANGGGSISVYSGTGSDGYIDDPGFTGDNSAVTKKAYFASNDGEIQCANGNKEYNLFTDELDDKLNRTYNSSEIDTTSRKQSLFYIDESICTLNSPEIEYDPTVQKIDLSTYKLNIIGAANITGYAQKINIDAETPPATAGTTVCEGFKFENLEVQNFNKEAYRYILSGGYWYDNVFSEGDDDEPEKKYDSADLISDQYCWWVYPFNRQILNNSKEGANGKLRTKQWYNYHYSAFNDYFGTSSIDYELKDAQQIYGDFQSVNFDSDWTTRKCMYFGSVDTAYTNPVPLVGVMGGSNDPNESMFLQSLAISPHTKFKDKDSYSSATYADIVPISFRSSNHFLLSFKGVRNNNRILPEYYTDSNLLKTEGKETVKIETQEFYHIKQFYNSGTGEMIDVSALGYYVKDVNYSGNAEQIYKLVDNGFAKINDSKMVITGGSSPVFTINYLLIHIDDEFDNKHFDTNTEIIRKQLSDKLITEIVFIQNEVTNDSQIEFLDENYVGNKSYGKIDQLIIDKQVDGCDRPYVEYKEEEAGIYKYGHVYIAQLERGVKSADEVFSGTEESVLLQNTWIPAGVAVSVNDLTNGSVKYTEGDTFYQRYDCLKTYGYNEASVNQVIESLSTMIQTRINLDGIYSLRGNIDNVGTNETNTNLLNTVYSQSDNYFTYSITDPYISEITEYSNMFTWTLTKQAMSRNDNWLAVNLIAYYNATGSFGKITRIINYRNNLFCFQDNAISQIAYNERVQLTPSDGVPIEIGNSGKVQGLNYISSNVGCQNRWSVCPSKGYLYWVDDRRAEIYRFGEGLEPFSTINGFSDWVKANTYGEDWKPILSTNVPITTYYDNNNDDIYFVTEKDCLAYNEKINAFESFFSYEDSFILNSAGNTIVIKEQDSLVKDMLDYTDIYNENDTSWWSNGIRGDGLSSIELMHEGEYNKFFGDYKPYYLRFKVYPTDLQRDKIYTNLEFNLDAFDEKDIYMPDDTFTRVRVWNEYQWGEMNFDNIYGTTSYKKRFRTWYLQLPRASYYPTGLYENYDYLYQRQLEWNYITSDVLANNTLAYYSYWNENSNCVNDRIRNPWVWLELYKNPKASLNFESYDFADAEVKNCTQAYYSEHKLDLFEIISGKFVRQEGSSSYDENKKYYNCIDDYLEKKNYLYYKVYVQVSSDNYDKYDILYSSTAEDAQPYTGDRTNPGLILYRLDYRNCANILTFDTEKVYYKLNISNNRMEIHDIILKYFEA